MDTETLLIKLAEDNHKIIEHNFRYGIEVSDIVDLVGHVLESCTPDERFRILTELGLCWFASEFDVIVKDFPVSE